MSGLRIIAGSGRSGTTWVQDALAEANNLRPVFEPLHTSISEIGYKYAYRALGPIDEHAELQAFMAEACAGRLHRLWTVYRRQPRWLFPQVGSIATRDEAALLLRRWWRFLPEVPHFFAAGRRETPIVKCIRANLMLGWLTQRCNCRAVLILRHPGAVIESELRGHWDAEFVLGRFRNDVQLHDMTGGRYLALLGRKLSPIESLTARWVIENQWPIEQSVANGVTVVFYEHLKSKPQDEWLRMCRALDLPNVPSESLRARPSQQSAKQRPVSGDAGSTQPVWMRALAREQIDTVQRILDSVEFDRYSMGSPMPIDSVRAPANERNSEIAC